MHILIADDSLTAIRRLQRIIAGLDLAPVEIVIARDGGHALDLIVQGNIDLLITEDTMPVFHGPELIRRLNLMDLLPVLPTVLVSPTATPALVADMRELGVPVVAKPVQSDDLARALAQVLAGWPTGDADLEYARAYCFGRWKPEPAIEELNTVEGAIAFTDRTIAETWPADEVMPPEFRGIAHGTGGRAALWGRHYDVAEGQFRRSLELLRDVEDKQFAVGVKARLVIALAHSGQESAAAAMRDEALAEYRTLNDLPAAAQLECIHEMLEYTLLPFGAELSEDFERTCIEHLIDFDSDRVPKVMDCLNNMDAFSAPEVALRARQRLEKLGEIAEVASGTAAGRLEYWDAMPKGERCGKNP